MLVAISIPIFTNQLEKAREATDESNCRSAYSEAMATYLEHASDPTPQLSGTVTVGSGSYSWNFDSDVVTVSGGPNKSKKYASGISYNGTAFGTGGATGGGTSGG